MGSSERATLDVLIDGRAIDCIDPGEVRRALLGTAASPFAEIWLSVNGGPAMALLKSGERALCLFVRRHGDPGFTSRKLPRENQLTGELTFHAGRSERAQGAPAKFPAAWTVPLFVALRAADEFLRTGEMPPQIPWHDDSPREKPARRSAKPAPSAKRDRKRST